MGTNKRTQEKKQKNRKMAINSIVGDICGFSREYIYRKIPHGGIRGDKRAKGSTYFKDNRL